MTVWRFIGAEQARQPLVGIGEGPFEDDEFGALVAAYEAQFSAEQAGAVRASGLYERVTAGKAPKEPAAARVANETATGPDEES